MNGNRFIDTNILIYCYTDDEPIKKQKALDIVNGSVTFISTQVLTEFSNTLKKKFKLDWQEVKNALSEVNSDFNVFVNNPSTIKQACQIADKYQYSFYDSLIVTSALECGCNILYSEDMQHGQLIENKLKIVNPFV